MLAHGQAVIAIARYQLEIKMVHTAGLEPAPSRFVAGGFIQLSYVCIAGSPTRTRTWPGLQRIGRLTAGCPAIERSGNSGGAPRARTKPSLQQDAFLQGRPAEPRAYPEIVVPGVGFDPTSPQLQCGVVTRSASQAIFWSGRRDSNSRLCVGAAGLYL